MQIIRYCPQYKQAWDTFIDSSKNGTFLLKRDYMEYHADRFADCSFLFSEKNKIVAVIPGNLDTEKKIFHSHQGLSYGGFILSSDITAIQTLEALQLLISFLKEEHQVKQIFYKALPAIYHRYPSDEDLYALFRHKAIIAERKISSAIKLSNRLPLKQLRKRGVLKARQNQLHVSFSSTGYKDFWEILNNTLQARHQVNPVHSSSELELLHQRFPDNIKLFEVKNQNGVIAGVLMYENRQTAHAQYIAANEVGKQVGALDLLFDYLINTYYTDYEYFDFGVSVENGGWFLNEGLIFQKEGFGGRAILYDTYLIDNL